CSGAMISPHIFMTAAHCSLPESTVRFFRIDLSSPNPGNSAQAYSETYAARSFPWQIFTNAGGTQYGDIQLWWVENGSDGIAPGIKYGHLELSTQAVGVGDAAYCFWVNSVNNFNGSYLSDTLLYSSGSVTALGPGSGGPPNFSDYNMYAAPGSS